MKVLNLYAGIGGNRKLWPDDCEVTAVEYDADIAAIYSDFYPQDSIIVGDAHDYLLNEFCNFDFIWSSPVCKTHGQYRHNVGVKAKGYAPVYPDMQLYEEIILLKHHFSGKWVVENTISYYEPLIQPQKVGRHYFWANYHISSFKAKSKNIRTAQIAQLQEHTGFDLSGYKLKNKREVLRNCVDSDLGAHVFNCGLGSYELEGGVVQSSMFGELQGMK